MKGQRLGEFEELILLGIRKHDEQGAHGVAIQRVLNRDADRSVSLGAIYAALDRLSRKGHVESWLGEPTHMRGGRPKRHYRLTPSGTQVLTEMRRVRNAMWKSEELSLDEAARQ